MRKYFLIFILYISFPVIFLNKIHFSILAFGYNFRLQILCTISIKFVAEPINFNSKYMKWT